MNYSVQGLNNAIAGKYSAEYWLKKVYPDYITSAHLNGDIYVHQLYLIAAYCDGLDLEGLLSQGFRGGVNKVESYPPKHLRSAVGQAANFMHQMSTEFSGAIAYSNFDTLLSPYVKKGNLDYKEVKQCIQEFVFIMNLSTRIGGQSIFSNVSLDIHIPDNYKELYPVIGGEIQKFQYKDCQHEGMMISKAFSEVMLKGDAAGQPHSFPIPTICFTKDFDWDNPDYDFIWKMFQKGIPYASNFVNSTLDPQDAKSLCCRLRIDLSDMTKHKDSIRKGGVYASLPSTGSIAINTVNLPRIGYLATDETDFFGILQQQLNIMKDALEIKRKLVEDLTEKGLYPYTKYWLSSIKEQTGRYFNNYFSTIGYVGMNECYLNFARKIGWEEPYLSNKGKEFAEKVLAYIDKQTKKFAKETGNRFNTEQSPSESSSHTLCKKDREVFGDDIVFSGVPGNEYYTNSCHVPVNATKNIFEVLDFQNDMVSKYHSGGSTTHIFLGEIIEDLNIVKQLIKDICYNYEIPYFTLSPNMSICPVHGMVSGEHWVCKKEHTKREYKQYGGNKEDGMPQEVWSRVTGFYRPVSRYNPGKQQEFKDRNTYDESIRHIGIKNENNTSK